MKVFIFLFSTHMSLCVQVVQPSLCEQPEVGDRKQIRRKLSRSNMVPNVNNKTTKITEKTTNCLYIFLLNISFGIIRHTSLQVYAFHLSFDCYQVPGKRHAILSDLAHHNFCSLETPSNWVEPSCNSFGRSAKQKYKYVNLTNTGIIYGNPHCPGFHQ